MARDYPDDATGAALQRIKDHGAHMDRPMVVDFHIAAKRETTAKQVAERLANETGVAEIYYTEEFDDWTCQYSIEMIVTYESITAMEDFLTEKCTGLDARLDGFGTFGNVDAR